MEQTPVTSTPKDDFPQELKDRAREFFRKGAEVAYAMNYDYAIELYLDGLNYWPDTVEEGHQPLREVALRRQAAGGKKSGLRDSSRYKKMSAKTAKESMLKAEFLLSKEPTNPGCMQDVIKAAIEGDFKYTAKWMADILFDFNLQQPKQQFSIYNFLRESYKKIEVYPRAFQACQQALNLKPNDSFLQNEAKDLSTLSTMQQGNYDTDEDFRTSIKNREQQDRQHADSEMVQTDEHRQRALLEARQEYLNEPTHTGKINKYVSLLNNTDKIKYENEAIKVLQKAYEQSQQFSFMQRAGEIQMKQWNRQVRLLHKQVEAEPGNAEVETKLRQSQAKLLKIELEHFDNCLKAYPTDMGIKYEYARRLLQAQKFDDAIPLFQDARSDPKFRVRAQNGIGQCFFYKQWYPDAAETFIQALETINNDDDPIAKEIRYNLGRAYEADGQVDLALSHFRKIAQIDFNYRDVRARVDQLRQKQHDKGEVQ